MKLRIHRTWEWMINCSPYEVVYGGNNPMKLFAVDILQYLDGDEWKDVEIVEEEQPEHPREVRERKRYEEMQKAWEGTFNELKSLSKIDIIGEK